jgi:hypothetical protein
VFGDVCSTDIHQEINISFDGFQIYFMHLMLTEVVSTLMTVLRSIFIIGASNGATQYII